MTLEVNTTMACNIKCGYCYENEIRDSGNFGPKFDWSKVKNTLDSRTEAFTLFGGEPLLLPLDKLEEVFKYGYKRFKYNSIQSNGLLITDRHIELFKKYRVHVGLSIDGPEGCNLARCSDKDTFKLLLIICKLLDEKVPVSLIITLHRYNTVEYKDKFLRWFRSLGANGIKSVRIHLLEDHDESLKVSQEETIALLKELIEINAIYGVPSIDLFDDVKALLLGNQAGCVWNACDPYTTPAVQGIDGDGTMSNCPRISKDGVFHRKADSRSTNERQIALANTPFEDNGCKGCKYFALCKGYCPGTAIDKDWRNRSEHCQTLKFLFSHFEEALTKDGRAVLSEEEMKEIEIKLTGGAYHSDSPHIDEHGDKFHLGTVPVGRNARIL